MKTYTCIELIDASILDLEPEFLVEPGDCTAKDAEFLFSEVFGAIVAFGGTVEETPDKDSRDNAILRVKMPDFDSKKGRLARLILGMVEEAKKNPGHTYIAEINPKKL